MSHGRFGCNLPKEMKTEVHTASLPVIAKNCKQPTCPSIGEGINRCGLYIHWSTTQDEKGANTDTTT